LSKLLHYKGHIRVSKTENGNQIERNLDVVKEPKAEPSRLSRVEGPNPHSVEDQKNCNLITMRTIEGSRSKSTQQRDYIDLRCDPETAPHLKSFNKSADHILPVIFVMV